MPCDAGRCCAGREELDKRASHSQNRRVKKILLVDHLNASLERESRILRDRGLQIFTATSAEEAVALHKIEKVHLIVTALDMPGTGGDGLCSLIRKQRELKSVSVIIICENRKADLDRCACSSANAFITKPFDPDAFLDKVSRLIEIPTRSGVRVLIKVDVKANQRSASFFCSSVISALRDFFLRCTGHSQRAISSPAPSSSLGPTVSWSMAKS